MTYNILKSLLIQPLKRPFYMAGLVDGTRTFSDEDKSK